MTVCALILADTFARVLGAAGLALSLVGTTLVVLSYRRDRAKLTIGIGLRYEPAPQGVPQDSTLVVVVANAGRRPVSIASVSCSSWGADHPSWKIRLLTRWPFLRRPLGVALVIFSAPPAVPIEMPIVLQPAESRQFEFASDAAAVERMKKANEHMFVSVVDIVGREVRKIAPVPSRVVSLEDGSIRIG